MSTKSVSVTETRELVTWLGGMIGVHQAAKSPSNPRQLKQDTVHCCLFVHFGRVSQVAHDFFCVYRWLMSNGHYLMFAKTRPLARTAA